MLTLDIKVKFYFYSYVLIIFWNIKKQNAFLKCILICRPCDKVKVLTLRCRISDFWSCCVVSWRSNRVILFQILLVSGWRIACPPTLFLAFPLAAAVFFFRWFLFVHSIWLIFQFPRCCSPYVLSIGLCFPWIFFNIRWTIWNFNSSFPFNEHFQYSLSLCPPLLVPEYRRIYQVYPSSILFGGLRGAHLTILSPRWVFVLWQRFHWFYSWPCWSVL